MKKANHALALLFIGACLLAASQCYNLQLAHDFAHLSGIAYESANAINSWSCSDCSKYEMKNQKAFFSPVTNIQGFAGYLVKENAVVVVFRGSVDVNNWIVNVGAASVGFPGCSGCTVHAGFYSAFQVMSPLVRVETNRLIGLYKTAKVYISGHSLGGAMAIHCALQMKQVYGNVDQVYTYGQPRVGNQKFAEHYQSKIPQTFRVINYADIVPHLPPCCSSFYHNSKQQWYTPRGMKTYKSCSAEDNNCANSISPVQRTADDHDISHYKKLAVNLTLGTDQSAVFEAKELRKNNLMIQ